MNSNDEGQGSSTKRWSSRLTTEEIDEIAEKAAEKALNKVYQEVGKGVLRKAAWLTGLVILGLLTWLGGQGLINK